MNLERDYSLDAAHLNSYIKGRKMKYEGRKI